MSNSLIALSQTAVKLRTELNLLGANVKGLKGPGRDLMPLKPDMLAMLPPEQATIVMDAVELLFGASMRFVAAQINEATAAGAVELVSARIDRGQAEATCIALLHDCAVPLYVACECAPIAMYAILHLAPELRLEDRLKEAMRKVRVF